MRFELELTDAQIDALAERVAERLQATAAPPSPWTDAKGAAERLCCSVDRVHDLVGLRKLTPRRDGRRLLFAVSELDAYVEGGR